MYGRSSIERLSLTGLIKGGRPAKKATRHRWRSDATEFLAVIEMVQTRSCMRCSYTMNDYARIRSLSRMFTSIRGRFRSCGRKTETKKVLIRPGPSSHTQSAEQRVRFRGISPTTLDVTSSTPRSEPFQPPLRCGLRPRLDRLRTPARSGRRCGWNFRLLFRQIIRHLPVVAHHRRLFLLIRHAQGGGLGCRSGCGRGGRGGGGDGWSGDESGGR